MIAAFLDSFLFGFPAAPTTDDVFSVVSSLLALRDIARSDWVKTYVSDQAVDCMVRAGCGFPPWEAINDCIRENDLELAPHDIVSLVDGLLNHLPKIEEAVGVRDILLDRVRCLPPIHEQRSDVFQSDFERLLGLVCLFIEVHGLGEADKCGVLSRDLTSCPTSVDFSAQLEAIDPSREEALPRQLATSTEVFGCSMRFFTALDAVQIWSGATSEDEFRAAVQLYTQQAAHVSGVPNARSWSFGSHFISTVEHLHLRHRRAAESILRSCSDTILKQNLGHTHAIRTTANANSPQVCRGKDTAWRRDVDYELHLHYWSTPAGPEFAAIRQHNDDVSIPV